MKIQLSKQQQQVSVPLRGFINRKHSEEDETLAIEQVSVPLRGFINRKHKALKKK